MICFVGVILMVDWIKKQTIYKIVQQELCLELTIEVDLYFSNFCNKCLDSNNDEINEILLKLAWISLSEGRWNDEYTFKTPFLKGTSDIEMNRMITCNCNWLNVIERINFKSNSMKRRKIWIVIKYHNYSLE